MSRGRIAIVAVGLAALAGCTVGPKYTKPSVPMTPAYKEPGPDSFKEANGWKPAQPGGQPIGLNWWEIFGDPQLNALEAQIDVSNQSLKAIEARFREARAAVRANRSALYPTVSAGGSVATTRDSTHKPYFNPGGLGSAGDFVLPVDLSYEVDLWGRVRRTIAASREEAQATAADLQTASLSLHAELALDYFDLRSVDAQKRLLDDTVKAYTDAFEFINNRFIGGAAAKAEVAQARTQLDSARVQDTDLGVQRRSMNTRSRS